jgi:hypothetical protein
VSCAGSACFKRSLRVRIAPRSERPALAALLRQHPVLDRPALKSNGRGRGIPYDRLTFVNKDWGPGFDNQSASALARALHNAVQALTANGARTCTASVEAIGATVSQTVFQCGRRRLVVVAPSDPDTNAGVSETLQ